MATESLGFYETLSQEHKLLFIDDVYFYGITMAIPHVIQRKIFIINNRNITENDLRQIGSPQSEIPENGSQESG